MQTHWGHLADYFLLELRCMGQLTREDTMSQDAPFELAHAKGLLRRTPAVLDTWLRDLPATWLHTNEGGDSFSPFEVVGHLIYGDRHDWIPRARLILAGEDEVFPAFDRFGQREEFRDRSIAELLAEFATLREQNLVAFDELVAPEKLDATGQHPKFGRVTLRQLMATWVVHDQSHIAQIGRVLAKRYRDTVGPWQAYLPVLAERA